MFTFRLEYLSQPDYGWNVEVVGGVHAATLEEAWDKARDSLGVWLWDHFSGHPERWTIWLIEPGGKQSQAFACTQCGGSGCLACAHRGFTALRFEYAQPESSSEPSTSTDVDPRQQSEFGTVRLGHEHGMMLARITGTEAGKVDIGGQHISPLSVVEQLIEREAKKQHVYYGDERDWE